MARKEDTAIIALPMSSIRRIECFGMRGIAFMRAPSSKLGNHVSRPRRMGLNSEDDSDRE